ncbi:MAG: dienelactone hydrolase family protein [Candidatus Sumerlaeaceae bacterium]|nr:dienelactone hydrolase family protein [Candidatus Sumerlaeaceae bacterium]
MGHRKAVLRVGRLAAVLIVLAAVTAAPAQGLLGLLAPRGTQDAFMSAGCPVGVEVFTPRSCAVAPAVIMLHGAEGLCENPAVYRMTASQLAGAGYVAIIVSYFDRTGTGPRKPDIGKDPVEFRAWVATVRDAISYAACLPQVDANRIALAGVSLGGYVAVATAAVDDRVRAVVEVAGGVPNRYVAAMTDMPPVLIVHGECDETVPVSEAYKLERLLKARDVCAELAIYPCQGHLLRGEAQRDALRRAIAFLRRVL